MSNAEMISRIAAANEATRKELAISLGRLSKQIKNDLTTLVNTVNQLDRRLHAIEDRFDMVNGKGGGVPTP